MRNLAVISIACATLLLLGALSASAVVATVPQSDLALGPWPYPPPEDDDDNKGGGLALGPWPYPPPEDDDDNKGGGGGWTFAAFPV